MKPADGVAPPVHHTQRCCAFDDEAAVLACARGERYSLRALHERESRWLLGVALSVVRDRARAEDVLQDAFIQVWQHAATFKSELGSARGWVYTIVRHRALKEARDVRRMESMDPPDLAGLSDPRQATAAPVSLGLEQAGQTVELPLSQLPGAGPRQLFEIALEPAGGSPLGRPSGPIAYVGRTVAI